MEKLRRCERNTGLPAAVAKGNSTFGIQGMTLLTRLSILCAALLLQACSPQEPLSLGFVSGQTGPFADLGAGGVNGAVLAVEERNARGGVAGRQVRLLIRDDQHDSARGQAALRALLAENVVAVLGPMTSAMAVEMVPLADAAETVLMGGTIVTKRLSGKDDFFMRPIAAAPVYAGYTATEHWRHWQPRRTAVLYDVANRDYAEDWAVSYAQTLQAKGGERVDRLAFDSRHSSRHQEFADRVAALQPDLVVLVCSAQSAAGFMRQLRPRLPAANFAASAWAANQELPDLAREAGEGALVEQYHQVEDDSPRYQAFVAAYQKRFSRLPDYAAVVAHDAATIVLDALEKNPQRQGLKAAILQQRRFAGLQGEIELDAYGDAIRQGFTSRIAQGRFHLLSEGAAK